MTDDCVAFADLREELKRNEVRIPNRTRGFNIQEEHCLFSFFSTAVIIFFIGSSENTNRVWKLEEVLMSSTANSVLKYFSILFQMFTRGTAWRICKIKTSLVLINSKFEAASRIWSDIKQKSSTALKRAKIRYKTVCLCH